jgi:DNA ligase-1
MPAFDGELIVGDPTNPASWNETSSGIMSEEGKPRFTFFVFDLVDCAPVMGFRKRYLELERLINKNFRHEAPFVRLLIHTQVKTLKALQEYEDTYVKAGYEGIMWRSPNGPYKWGRSTWKEGHLLKIKRFHDAEAVVIGFEEKRHNANVAKTNALGLTERSSHKANQIAMNTLGALIVRIKREDLPGVTEKPLEDPENRFVFVPPTKEEIHVEFRIGTGFDDTLRKWIWANRKKCLGEPVTFKYQKLSPLGKPIFPSFMRFPNLVIPKKG